MHKDLLKSIVAIGGLAVVVAVLIFFNLPGPVVEPDATYTGQAESYGGTMNVTVGLARNEIVAIDVSHTDTPGIANPAIETVRSNILSAQNVDVDGKSGATVTVNAVKEAVARALHEAGWSESRIGMALPEVPTIEPDVTYSGTAESYGGPLTVTVGLKDGEIVTIEVEHEDTPGIARPVINEIRNAVISAQSADVDLISGATVTSRALVEAISEALTEAGF